MKDIDQNIPQSNQRNHNESVFYTLNQESLSLQEYVMKRFPIFFANHTIAVAFTILYSYYEFEVVMCYLHFLFYLLMAYGIYKEREGLKKIGLIMCYFIDVILIIASMAALSQMKSRIVG